MKIIFIALSLLCFLCPAYSNDIVTYSTGENLHIWAISGLNLRTEPNAKSTKVANIPFGARVKVVDSQPHTHPFSYTMVKSKTHDKLVEWIVDGYWVKVEYQDQTGYVFDGYLGKLPVITDSPEHIPYFNLVHIKAYGAKHWGGLAEETKTTTLNFEDNQRDPDKGHSSSYILTFKNGAYYENEEASFSGSTSIFIKDISLVEAYLLFNALTGFEYKQKLNRENGDPILETRLSSLKDNELRFFREGMSTNITKVDGGVIIQSGGGC